MIAKDLRHALLVATWLLPIFLLGPEVLAAQPNKGKGCPDAYKLCIGVRSIARPFSYKAEFTREMSSDATLGPLRSAGYTGYMVHICDAVLAEMMLNSGEGRPIISSREVGYFDLDDPSPFPDGEDARRQVPRAPQRFSDLGKRYDILCDPATITNDRRNEFIVSPPLFLTGISYITLKGGEVPREVCDSMDKALLGVVGGSTANKEGLWALLRAGELPKYKTALLSYLKSEPSVDSTRRSPCKGDKIGRIKEFATHKEAAAAFCKGEVFHYVGDIEIITENVKLIPGCDYDNGARTFTNDRYAIFGRPVKVQIDSDSPDDQKKQAALEKQEEADFKERQLLVAQFFHILAQKTVFNPSVLDKAYSDTFQDATPSRKLDVFFWSVRGGKLKVR